MVPSKWIALAILRAAHAVLEKTPPKQKKEALVYDTALSFVLYEMGPCRVNKHEYYRLIRETHYYNTMSSTRFARWSSRRLCTLRWLTGSKPHSLV
jgi:GH24 family phage-related lysozyme (muramidase)